MFHNDPAHEIDLLDDEEHPAGWVQRTLRRRRVELTKMAGHDVAAAGGFPCPACGAEGQIDIREGATGRVYLSCPACFKMWQEVREPLSLPGATWTGD